MAKKVVATLKKEGANKQYARVIKAVKSDKSGAYSYREEMVPVDMVKETLAK